MKKLLSLLLLISFISNAQTTKIKYKQMENPATSSVNIGAQTLSVSVITGSTTMGTGTVAANTSSLGIVRIKQGSSWVDIGESSSGLSGLWMNTTNTTANHFLLSNANGNSKYINAPSSLNFGIGGVDKFTLNSSGASLTGTMSVSGASTLTGAVIFQSSATSSSKTGGIGYAVGSGSTVTQTTNRTTGVTINAITGAITLVSAAGTTAWQTFVVTNSAVSATDVIIVNQKSGTDLNEIHVTAVGASSFNITFRTTGGTTSEQPVFNFAVIKGQTN